MQRPAEVETQVPRRQVHVPRQHGLQGRQASKRRRRADFHSFIWRLINLLHLTRHLPIVSSLAGQAARDPCGGLGGGASSFSKQPFSSMRLGLLFLTKHHGLQPTSTRLLGTKNFGPPSSLGPRPSPPPHGPRAGPGSKYPYVP